MARKNRQDAAKAKAAKQKKLAIGGGVLLVALLAFQAPKMMKAMNQKPKAPVIAGVASTPTTDATAGAPTAAGAPTDPNAVVAPTLAGAVATPTATTASTDLVSAVPVQADNGQLETFNRFATKDPFLVQAGGDGSAVPSSGGKSSSGSGSGSGSSQTPTTPAPTSPSPAVPSPTPTPAAPAPTSATISVNGEAAIVGLGSDFPLSGVVFNRVGSMFHLVSLTAKTAKISIVGGAYADGAHTITLKMGVPLTLQNTADGSKYVLILQPTPGSSSSGASGSTPPPTTTTPASGNGGATMSAIVPPASTH